MKHLKLIIIPIIVLLFSCNSGGDRPYEITIFKDLYYYYDFNLNQTMYIDNNEYYYTYEYRVKNDSITISIFK